MSKKIFWIASYPKSGNTWVRSIVASLLYTTEGIFNFDLFKLINQFDKKTNYEFIQTLSDNDYKKFNKDLTCISKYWIEAQKRIINSKELNPVYNIFKTHSANLYLNNNNRYTSEETTRGFIYIIRDPRDVVVSFSKHLNKNIDDTISVMTSNGAMTTPSDNRTLTLISSWNMHYESWNTLKTPFLILKYEDLLKNIEFEVKRIIEFLGKLLEINVKDLNKKLEGVCKTTNINKFIEYENKFGFGEATKNQKFFSKIQSNSKKELSIGQTKTIEAKFYKIMKEFSYIN